MRSHTIVMAPPTFDDDPGLLERVEALSVEQLIAHSGIEALDVAVLPRAARCDVGGLRADRVDPCLNRLGDKLGAVVGANVARHAAQNEQVAEHVDDIRAVEPAIDPDRQTFVCELVDDIEHSILPSLMGAVLHEIVRPDMVGPLGTQAHARAVIEPKAAPLGLLGWNFQPFASPDAFDTLVVDKPTSLPEQRGDPAVAIAAVFAGEFNDVGGQPFLIFSPSRRLALRRTVLAEYPTRPALGNAKLLPDVLDARPASRRAQ